MSDWISRYLTSVGDALSQLLNALVFFSMNANQSVSGRCDDERHKPFWKAFGNAINYVAWHVFGNHNHCRSAAVNDTKRAKQRLDRFGAAHGVTENG